MPHYPPPHPHRQQQPLWHTYVLGGTVPREAPPRWVVLLVLAVVVLGAIGMTALFYALDYAR